jgi:hypothetical protein
MNYDKLKMAENLENKLINFLLGIPEMSRRETRDLLLANLPEKPVSLMTRDDASRQDLAYIVKSAIQFGQVASTEMFAIEILIQNAKPFVEGLDKENQLKALLQEFQGKNQDKSSPQNLQLSPAGPETVPFVIVSMTLDEANQLKEKLNTTDNNLKTELNNFRDLTESLKDHGVIEFTRYYGRNREDWKPYTCSDKTIKEIILEIVNEVNEYYQQQESNMSVIKPYFLSTDCFESDFSKRANTWHELRQQGCVIIVDSVSLFHPGIRDKFLRAEISSNENVSILTLSPVNPCMVEANKILEELVINQMEPAFLRFNEHLDRRCEMGVGDLRSIKRWFFSVLPEAVEILSRQKPQPGNCRLLRETLGPRNGIDKLWRGNA